MKDVAILTKYYKNYNYGGMLQGYALYKVIIDMGYSCDIISYDVKQNSNPIYSNVFQQCKQYGMSSIIYKLKEKIIGKCKFIIKETLVERVRLFDEFMDWVNAGTVIYTDSNLQELNSKYKIFISGSDQVWNPNAVRNMYLQNFVANDNKKISYAASIGRDKFIQHEVDVLIPALNKFDVLSVREKTAKELLQKYIQKEIVTVVDPTMLLSVHEWKKVVSYRLYEQPYALFYFFSDSLKIRKKVERFCKENGLKMLLIPYVKQEFNFNDNKGRGIRLSDVGPKEFLSVIKYAEYIFTDSFHGAVFSIIYNKQFVVFERNRAGHVSMNSRLHDLLETFDLKDRLMNILDIEKLNKLETINYDIVNNNLQNLVEESIMFLKNAILDSQIDIRSKDDKTK